MQIVCSGCLKPYNLLGPAGKQFRCRCGNKLTMPQQEVKEQFGIVLCSGCWTRYSVAGRKSGAKFKCRTCGNIVTVRNTGTTSPQAPVLAAEDPSEAQTQVIPLKGVRQRTKEASAARQPAAKPASGKAVQPASDRFVRPASEKVVAPAAGKPARATPPPVGRGAGRPASGAPAKPKSAPALKPPHAPGRATSVPAAPDSTAEIAALKKELAAISERFEEVSKSRDKLEKTLSEKEALSNAKDAEIATLNTRLEHAEAEVTAANGALARTQAALGSAKDKVAQLENDGRQKDADIAALNQQITELNGKIGQLQAELETRVSREETERFKEEKKRTEEMVSNVSVEVAATREALSGILERAGALVSEIAALRDAAGKFDNLPDVLAELQAAKEAATKHRADAEAAACRLAAAEKKTHELTRQLQLLEQAARERGEAGSFLQRGAAKLLGLFGKHPQETTAETTRTPSPVFDNAEGEPTFAADVVQPDEVADLGEEVPAPEPLPADNAPIPPPPNDREAVQLPDVPVLGDPEATANQSSAPTSKTSRLPGRKR